MKVIEDLKGKVNFVVINKVSGVNTGYHLEEEAEEEVIIDRIIFGAENIKLVKAGAIQVIDELDYHGGDVKTKR